MTIETINIGATPNDGTGDDPRTAGQKLNSNFTTSTHAASRDVGTASGNVMEVGAGGLLSNNANVELPGLDNDATRLNGMFRLSAANTGVRPTGTIHQVLQMFQGGNFGAQLALSGTEARAFLRNVSASAWSDWQELYHSGNLNPNVFGGSGSGRYVVYGWAQSATTARFILPVSLISTPASVFVEGTFLASSASTSFGVASSITYIAASSDNKSAVIQANGLSGMSVDEPLTLFTSSLDAKLTVNA